MRDPRKDPKTDDVTAGKHYRRTVEQFNAKLKVVYFRSSCPCGSEDLERCSLDYWRELTANDEVIHAAD